MRAAELMLLNQTQLDPVTRVNLEGVAPSQKIRLRHRDSVTSSAITRQSSFATDSSDTGVAQDDVFAGGHLGRFVVGNITWSLAMTYRSRHDADFRRFFYRFSRLSRREQWV